jgi:hypothetical protein
MNVAREVGVEKYRIESNTGMHKAVMNVASRARPRLGDIWLTKPSIMGTAMGGTIGPSVARMARSEVVRDIVYGILIPG